MKRERPGLDQALASVRTGDTLVVLKPSPMQQRELKRMHQSGEYKISDRGELFSVSRPTMYRTISRTNP